MTSHLLQAMQHVFGHIFTWIFLWSPSESMRWRRRFCRNSARSAVELSSWKTTSNHGKSSLAWNCVTSRRLEDFFAENVYVAFFAENLYDSVFAKNLYDSVFAETFVWFSFRRKFVWFSFHRKFVWFSFRRKFVWFTVLSMSTEGRRKASATSLREVGYFFP